MIRNSSRFIIQIFVGVHNKLDEQQRAHPITSPLASFLGVPGSGLLTGGQYPAGCYLPSQVSVAWSWELHWWISGLVVTVCICSPQAEGTNLLLPLEGD